MKKKSRLIVTIALLLCCFSMIFSGLIQSDFGKVELTEVRIATEAGHISGYLLVPKTASSQTPLPAAVCIHGYLNNKEMQDSNWIELSRRGYVVLAIDQYYHGESSIPKEGTEQTVQVSSGGLIEAVEYVSSLPYVDASRIGIVGHSKGGDCVNTTMNYYTNLEREALAVGASEEDAHKLNKVALGVMAGMTPFNVWTAETPTDGEHGYLCDVAVIMGKYDEFQMQSESLGCLNSDTNKHYIAIQTGNTIVGDIEEGKAYESANGYSLTFYNPAEIHALNHFSIQTETAILNLFEDSIGSPVKISSTNQMWWVKELIQAVGLVGFFLFVAPFADFILSSNIFKSLRSTGTNALPYEQKSVRRSVALTLVGGIFSAILIIPIFTIGQSLTVNSFWPQDNTGAIGLWSLLSGLISILVLRISVGKFKDNYERLGIKTRISDFGKTLIVAVITVVVTFMLLFIADYLFKTDYRLWCIDIRAFEASKIHVAIQYIPLFALFYIMNSVSVTYFNYEGWSDRKKILVVGLLNIFAPLLVIAITYIPILFVGESLWVHLFAGTSNVMLMYICSSIPSLCIPFVPFLFAAAYINVKCYKYTGKIWLGALINAMLITMITVANTAFTLSY